MDRRRRRILRGSVLGAFGVLAGCLGGDSSDGVGETHAGTRTTGGRKSTDPTPTDSAGTPTADPPTTTDRPTTRVSPLGTSRTVSGAPVTVAAVAVRDSLVHAPYPDELGVADADGGRYVLARVEAPEGGPDRHAFELVAGDRRYPFDLPYTQVGISGFDRLYGDRGEDRGWLGFRVPAPLEGGPVRVEAGDAAWRLPDEAVERLRQPKPTFELVEFAVPEAVDPHTAFDVEAVFRNTGDRPGTVRAALAIRGAGFPCCGGPHWAGEVPAGGHETWRESLGGRRRPDPGYDDVTIRLKFPGGVRERTVAVNEGTTVDDG